MNADHIMKRIILKSLKHMTCGKAHLYAEFDQNVSLVLSYVLHFHCPNTYTLADWKISI